jgi:hypothetical protein
MKMKKILIVAICVLFASVSIATALPISLNTDLKIQTLNTSGPDGTFTGTLSWTSNGKKIGEISGNFPTKNKFQGNWNTSTNFGTVQFFFGRYNLIVKCKNNWHWIPSLFLITGFYTFNETTKTFAGKLQPQPASFFFLTIIPIYFQGICT